MTETSHSVEVWIVMNEVGEYVVASDEATATELADSEFGNDADVRYVTLKIKMRPPSDKDTASQSFDLGSIDYALAYLLTRSFAKGMTPCGSEITRLNKK